MICWLVFCVLILASVAFQIWMIVDAAKKVYPQGKENEKIVWILIILVAGAIGALIYYFVEKPKYAELQPAKATVPLPPVEKPTETDK
jgi:hypothetical protein